MLALAENPPILPPHVGSLAELDGPWWIAHTKSRMEKALTWSLLKQGIGYFMPMVDRITFSGGRRRHGRIPMFPSYVFFCGASDARYAAVSGDRICQVLEVKNQKKFLDELLWIESAVRGGAQLDPYPFAAVGKRCRVRSGPLVGVHGIVMERSSFSRLVLQVSLLGQGVALQIHPDLLEPLD
jgi:hypothetical protein